MRQKHCKELVCQHLRYCILRVNAPQKIKLKLVNLEDKEPKERG